MAQEQEYANRQVIEERGIQSRKLSYMKGVTGCLKRYALKQAYPPVMSVKNSLKEAVTVIRHATDDQKKYIKSIYDETQVVFK